MRVVWCMFHVEWFDNLIVTIGVIWKTLKSYLLCTLSFAVDEDMLTKGAKYSNAWQGIQDWPFILLPRDSA